MNSQLKHWLHSYNLELRSSIVTATVGSPTVGIVEKSGDADFSHGIPVLSFVLREHHAPTALALLLERGNLYVSTLENCIASTSI